jgi:outer membrane lipoprotein-sorting protein
MGFLLSRRARWAVPAAALAVTGSVMAGSLISVAQAAPRLPSRTPAQLLAQVAQSQPPPLSGTVVETASLGLPSLPHTGNPTSIASLLTGSHTIRVWYAGSEHYRLAVPESLSESDVVRDGSTVWLWQSTKNAVTEFSLNANANAGTGSPCPRTPAQLTPQQAAQQVLAKVGPTTTVGVDSNVTVAGQAAYELVLAPKDSRSLIGQVRIAVDGQHGVPLRVEVFARGASSPAISIGYTAIRFGVPPASDTSFTPPPGAKITKVDLSTDREAGPGGSTIGSGWLTVVRLPSSALASGGTSADSSGENADVLRALLASAQSVRGTWGSGQLLRTSLISVLMTSDGRTFIGAVQPGVLYAAAAHR